MRPLWTRAKIQWMVAFSSRTIGSEWWIPGEKTKRIQWTLLQAKRIRSAWIKWMNERSELVSQPGNINIMTCEVNSIIVFARNLRRAKYNNGENEAPRKSPNFIIKFVRLYTSFHSLQFNIKLYGLSYYPGRLYYIIICPGHNTKSSYYSLHASRGQFYYFIMSPR